MNVRRTILAGTVGFVIVVTVIALTGEVVGSDGDICALAGTVLTGQRDALGLAVGFAANLVVALVAAFVYAAVFEWVTRRAGAIVGFLLAIPHMMLAGLVVGFLPAGGLERYGLTPPGGFLEYRGGWVVAAFVIAHLAFGVVVGALYGDTCHRVPSARPVWRDISSEAMEAGRRAD